MKRRAFLLSGLYLAAIGREGGAQSATDLPRVAILSPDLPTAADPAIGNPFAIFLEALHERGYVDGRNIRLDFRFAENRLDRLPALAAELVKAGPAVIYTHTTAGAFAAWDTYRKVKFRGAKSCSCRRGSCARVRQA